MRLPFNIACGFSKRCEQGLTNYCLTMQPEAALAAYGFDEMGAYQGGQAELLRVPHGDFNALRLGEDAAGAGRRADQVGGEGQIVRARLPGLFLLAQRVPASGTPTTSRCASSAKQTPAPPATD